MWVKRFLLLLGVCFSVFSLAGQNDSVESEELYVMARGGIPVYEDPSFDHPPKAMPQKLVDFRQQIVVSKKLLRVDSLNGMAGNWRIFFLEGKPHGFVFDAYLFRGGGKKPTPMELDLEWQNRQLAGLRQVQLQTLNTLEKRTLYGLGGFGVLVVFLTVALIVVFRQGRKLKTSPKTTATTVAKLDDSAIEQLVGKVSKKLDPKLKNFAPNIIELIQIQLKEFDQRIDRKYERKNTVKKVVLERTDTTSASGTATEAPPSWDKDQPLFSSYLNKGFERQYVQLPRNNRFFSRTATSEVQDNSVYELYVIESDPSKALFRLIDEAGVLTKALLFPNDYIYPVCEVYGSGDIRSAVQLEYTFGLAVRDGKNWRIMQKAKLRYYQENQFAKAAVEEAGAWETEESTVANPTEPPPVNPVVEESTVFYAVAPVGGAFYRNNLSDTFTSGWQVFKIQITGLDTAVFSMVEDNASQTKAFHLPKKYILPGFETIGQGSIYVAERAEMVKAGELERDGEKWVITKKGVIQFFKS